MNLRTATAEQRALCLDRLELLCGRRPVTDDVSSVAFPDKDRHGRRTGNIGGPDVSWCSLPDGHRSVQHAAHRDHDLSTPPLVLWTKVDETEAERDEPLDLAQ